MVKAGPTAASRFIRKYAPDTTKEQQLKRLTPRISFRGFHLR
ncbi:MAG: hypothetical protein Q8P67_16685 [archaeon]|nr:hypothetical protein [archaeon]